MSKKVLLSMLVGMFVMAIAGLAAATAPVDQAGVNPPDTSLRQPGADPEMDYSNSSTWQERGPVETGSMPGSRDNSPDLRCCAGDSGPMRDPAGDTVLRHGIDDGP